jgi:hypothetical protein
LANSQRPNVINKNAVTGCSERLRSEARDKSTSGGVLAQHVDARRLKRNEAYEAFSAVC